MIGKTLGHYSVASLLGKGGMGEVYRAKDQKLGREVAIKVLPEEFAKDADRVARFQREAKLLASLNHPNIASIYGLEESDGTHFLVLELIEGDTLADRLKRGAIPVEESLKLALQIAEALEAAHEKGVIHRDLKPANIKVTPDGKVKVLDFGLAKAFAGDSEDMNLSNSPTLSVAATQQGIILGTAAYMSPEQASGETTDKRADVWAFGVVLFEMLTGRSLFGGNSVSQTLARVLEREPDFSALPPNLHFRIRLLLERCLKKEPKDRYGAISDARVDIQEILAGPSGVFAQPVTVTESRTGMRKILPWVAAALVIGAIIAGVAVWMLRSTEPKRVTRLEYQVPEGQQLSTDLIRSLQTTMAISPDGTQLVYGTTKGFYLRSMDSLDARLISGTDKDSAQPFFSPDGQWMGYISISDRKLMKVAISGGAPIVLCDIGPQVYGACWYPEDTIIYSELPSGVMRVSSNGGTPETLIKANLENIATEGFPAFPRMLPDGKTLLFTNVLGTADTQMQIVIQSLKSGERKVLVKGGVGGRYLPSRHIVYKLTNNLFAVPFDLNKLAVTGGSVSVLENVGSGAISDSGTLVYVPRPAAAAGASSTALSADTLVWVDRHGKEKPLAAEPGRYNWLRISPDGTRVALTVDSVSDRDIWIWDLDRETMTRLTFAVGNDASPIWTPDSQRIIFASARESTLANGIWWKKADGTGEVEKLYSGTATEITGPFSSSKDGKTLVLWTLSLTPVNANIETLSMDDSHVRNPLLQKNYNELYPQVSPDGRWIAYQSNGSGRYEVFVNSFPDVNQGMWQVSKNGGDSPLWSPDGKELFYHNGDSFIAVEVETDPTFKIGNSAVLFKGRYARNADANECVLWDIHPDGKRFLMIRPPATAAAESSSGESATSAPQPKIIVVLNWFEELKKRVPIE